MRSTCLAPRRRKATRCRRAMPACAATSTTAPSAARSRSSIQPSAREFQRKTSSARCRITTSAEVTSRPSMREPSQPLSRPLPHDVAAGESAFIQYYQKYAVFSWPWAWRRTIVFGSLGVLAGISFGASHGLFVRDVGEGITVSLVCALANIALVGAGPALGAFFRHRGWPSQAERVAIVFAVICGVFIGAWTDDLASRFHDYRMAAHGFHGSG